MSFIVVGLGNPGSKYVKTRHNAGRIVLQQIAENHNFSKWKEQTRRISLESEGRISELASDSNSDSNSDSGSNSDFDFCFVLPEDYMNNSGKSVAPLMRVPSDLEKLIVVYDDIDLPLGTLRVSFERNSGGHNGLASIMTSLGRKDFTRIRVGIAPSDENNKVLKPHGEEAVLNFLMTSFTPAEKEMLATISEKVAEILITIAKEGKEVAMNNFNSK